MPLPSSRFRQLARPWVIVLAGGLAAGCAPSDAPESAAATGSDSAGLGPPGSPFTQDGERVAAAITSETLLEHVLALSGDDFEGRGPASAGDRVTQRYLSEQLAAIGFEPAAADGAWLQPFDIVGIDPVVPETWEFNVGDEALELARWDEFVATSGAQVERASVEDAEVVFVGYGIEAPEYDWNDFKGQDLSGKVPLMMNNDPEWDPDLFEGVTRLYYGRWMYKYESAARQGAVGAIIIHTTPSAGYPWQVVQTSWTGEYFRLPATGAPFLQIEAFVTEAAAAQLVAMAGKDLTALVESARSRDFEPVPLGVTTSLALDLGVTKTQTANVLGVLPGSDPELADEFVILTAHHDHLGVGVPDDSGDDIYNGARDNALGVSTVLNVAAAYAALPEAPRRSILVAFVGAEEQGLLGSQYYAQNPTVPPGRMAANMNFDGGNIWGRSPDVTYIGYGKSSLGPVTEFVAARQGRGVVPDQYPDRGYYYRSDQFNFAKIGVPATYFDRPRRIIGRPDGWAKEQIEAYENVRYHQPSDEYYDEWTLDALGD
ncbi:MAG: M28 family peptidase [Gammaproteobacteria bacterium]|nr:M28 family peptidase [Gammaproteobacteria bacterium]